MSAVIMLFILTLILFVQRGGWALQSHWVDIRVSPTAVRFICQQIHGNAVIVALPWWGQTNIVELQRWRFLPNTVKSPYIYRDGGPRTHTVQYSRSQCCCVQAGGYTELRCCALTFISQRHTSYSRLRWPWSSSCKQTRALSALTVKYVPAPTMQASVWVNEKQLKKK